MKHASKLVLATALTVASGPALAHVGVGPTAGLAAGAVHPLTGIDHLLAMVAVGLWAAQLGGRSVWALPAAFMTAMALGAVTGMAGLAVPFVETGIVLSVILLGVAIAASFRPNAAVGMAAVALAGVLHGHAHGTEMPLDASGLTYAAGFLAATAALHAAGVLLGKTSSRGAVVARAAGGLVCASGLMLAAGIL